MSMAENPSTRLSAVPPQCPPSITTSSPKTPTQLPKQQEPQFPSYLHTPNVSPRARVFCEILANASLPEVETALSSTGIHPVPEVVEEVLKLSYGSPSAAVKFFRWAGLKQKHSAYAWNLMVDSLGKNKLFEPMWDAIRSMKQEGVLSMVTFVSVFGSYCSSGRSNEAIMTFDVMEKYGIEPDIVAVNSLLSTICREDNQTTKALEFFDRIKTKIAPDGDSFAILLEGWEKECNVAKAKTTFGEMVIRVGWSPHFMPAYDAFLTTLVRGMQVEEATKFLQVMKGKNCFPGLKFFSNAIDILVKQQHAAHAVFFWDLMVSCGYLPNLVMYNSMIGLLCNINDIANAFHFLDGMAFHGAFPDSLSYNMIFHCLIKNKKVREACSFFYEMIKNECPPSHANCASAITMFMGRDDPEMALEVWESMLKNCAQSLEEGANALLIGMTTLDRLTDVLKLLEDILDRRIKINNSTMEKMRNAFSKGRRSTHDAFESLIRKCKSS